MDRRKLERISEILGLILHTMGGETYSKTKLVKLAYLLAVIHKRRQEPEFTGIDFKSYYYGPYSQDIEDGLEYLKEYGYISFEKRISMDGNPYYHIQLRQVPQLHQLTPGEQESIRRDLEPLVGLSLRQLLDIAYDTDEYKSVEFGESIDL